MPRQWRAALRGLGNTLSPEKVAQTREIVAPHALVPDRTCRVERDIPYGPDPRHRLDLFRPAKGASPSSIVMFVHGGGFVGGSKGGDGTPFYDNFGAWAVREGFIGVTIHYRLAPDHPWPAGAQDVGAAVDWLRDNAPAIGVGGESRIVLTGESAGAAHVAGYLAGRSGKPLHPCVRGAILMSGQYDVSGPLGPLESAYYGAGARDPVAQSTLPGLIDLDIPCMFAIAEHDAPQFQAQAALVVERWFAARGALPNLYYIAGGNHFSTSLCIGSEGDMFSDAMADFIREATRD